ncbi:penicillin-binding protein 2 [bacterium]|nr:penicillin-binding protein 2 [bacterium]
MGGWSGKTRNRLIFLYWLFTLFYICLIVRLAGLQWLKNERLQQLARYQQEGDIEVPALRGDIRDRNGVVLANSISLSSLAVNPKEVKDVAGATKRLSALLDMPEKRVQDALTGKGTFQWIARKIPDEVAKSLKEQPLAGVFLLREPTPGRRYYPKGRLLCHLMGSTGLDEQGLDGLEASYDEYLGGAPGVLRTFMDRDGWMIPVETSRLIKKAVPGRHLVLTIDETIQYVAERELNAAVKLRNAKGGICIVMDAKTAGILALAVAPDFPAEKFSEVPPEVRRNRAITDPYEPGSTFKVFTMATAVNHGIKPTDLFPSSGVISIGGWTINNANDGLGAQAMEPVSEILAFSFNVGTAHVALRLGKKVLCKGLEDFGFGYRTGVDLTGESEGIMAPLKDWEEINLMTISFGQGVAATPMQLVSAMQAIANKGVRLKPHVVQEVLNPDNTVYKKIPVKEINRPITPESAATMLQMLRGVCDHGTGKHFANIPGYRTGGKTGTAQVVHNGAYGDTYIGSFLGVCPVEDPRIVVLVKIEEPTPIYWGGTVAAPVFARVAQEAMWKLGVNPSHPEEISSAAQGGQNSEPR